MSRAAFVAEVSSNHNQDLSRSLAFIDVAADIGCAAVKFQLFKIERLFSPDVLEKREDLRARKKWELPVSFLPRLAERCKKRGIQFSCTPFYLEAIAELAPYVDFYKIASYELLREDLLIGCARTGKPVMLSTGMAVPQEIVASVEVLKRNGCSDLTLLQCVSGYPAPLAEANLAAIQTLREIGKCRSGWSDHTVNPAVIYRAVHRWGADAIEFHLDLDGTGEEFKIGHCWLPDQIGAVIRTIREGFLADGSGIKAPSPSELSDREWRSDPTDGWRPFKATRRKLG